MHILKRCSIAASLLFAFAGAPASAANLIQNGSFEAGWNGVGYQTYGTSYIPAANGHLAYWTIDSGNVDIINTYWDGSDADNLKNDASVDLNGTVAGKISQAFGTMVGAKYSVSFDIAGNHGANPTLKEMDVVVTGTSQPNAVVTNHYSFDDAGRGATNMGWVGKSFEFVANDTLTRLSFASTIFNTNQGGMALDNVQVHLLAIPEPETWALLLAGLGLLGLSARRRNRAAA
jgi:choice-of-anchor C domain-containing protein